MVCDIDACTLAVARAKLAVNAFGSVDYDAEKRELGEEAKRCAHWAYRIAIDASVAPRENGKYGEGSDCHDKHTCPFAPILHFMESIAVMRFGPGCEKVISPYPYRLE